MSASPTQVMNNPSTRVSGKPMEKMFSCGAARVITPNAMLTTSNAVIAGKTNTSAAPSTQPSLPASCQKLSTINPLPTGNVVKLSVRTSKTTRWPFIDRNNSVTSMVKNCPITATDTPLVGSTMDAKPMPIWIATICPATTNAWKNNCKEKPNTAPMMICSPISSSPLKSSGLTGGMGGNAGVMTTVIASAKYARTRLGTRVVPKIGMTISKVPTRNSGNMNVATQVLIWVSVSCSRDMT